MRQKGFAPVLILFVVVSAAILGYLVISGKPRVNSPQKTTNAETSSSVTPAATIAPTPFAVSKLYLVKLNLKSETNPAPIREYSDSMTTLGEYLEILFKIPSKSVSNILYNAKNGSPYNSTGAVFKTSYYLILNQPVKLDSKYSDQYLTATLQTLDDAMLPYLIKNDYCEKDSDCSIRNNVCTIGAYNNYQGYIDPPWGCGPGAYKGVPSFEYGAYDDELKCNLGSIEFDGAKCNNHICIETGYKKICATN